jgi:hypothetical protein
MARGAEMKKYPLIESLDLEVKHAPISRLNFVDADQLENILSEGVKVYGDESESAVWDKFNGEFDTHTALLINIKPTEKPVTKKEIIEKLEDLLTLNQPVGKFREDTERLIKRIESQGVE